jgi:hypothetical protein
LPLRPDALACSTAAAVDRNWPVASSRSFCERAFCRKRYGALQVLAGRFEGRLLFGKGRFGLISWTWKGLGSIRKRTSPSLTMAPSVYNRLSRKPLTRAWMLTCRELCTWATYSKLSGTSRASSRQREADFGNPADRLHRFRQPKVANTYPGPGSE